MGSSPGAKEPGRLPSPVGGGDNGRGEEFLMFTFALCSVQVFSYVQFGVSKKLRRKVLRGELRGITCLSRRLSSIF